MATDLERAVLSDQREERWEWWLFDLEGQQSVKLDGVDGATLEWSNGATINGSGKLTYRGEQIDWLKHMLQPVYHVKNAAGEVSWPMGMFIPSTPVQQWDDVGDTGTLPHPDRHHATLDVDLYDKLMILSQDAVEETYTVTTGTNVLSEIIALVASSAPGAILGDESDEVLTAPMIFEGGSSKLSICNKLLESINYFSLWVDGFGRFRAQHYTEPSARVPVWDFKDDHLGIYEPAFNVEQDIFNIPNRVIEIGQPDDQEAVLTASAENLNPDDPASYPARGRWVTQVDTDVEATSQVILDAIAQRRLVQLAGPSRSLELTHAHVPFNLNEAVTFRSGPADVDSRGLVQSYSIDTSVGGITSTKLLLTS